MNVKILNKPPLSGLYDEVKVNINDKSIFVMFEDSDYNDFCGVFGGGATKYSSATIQNNIAFIVSFGQGYIFNINKRKVMHITTSEYIQNVNSTGYNNFIICNDNDEVFVYKNELIWKSGCISADGIIIDKIDGVIVKGKVNAFTDWEGFTLDLSSFSYNCSWICELNDD